MPRRATAHLAAILVTAAATSLFAADGVFSDGFESGSTCGWGFGSASCPGFEIRSPAAEVPAGEQRIYCYYFHAPITATLGIRRWVMTLDAGVDRATLFATYDGTWAPADQQPAGTLAPGPCGFGTGGGYTAWMFAAHSANEELSVPADDGAGQPLAVEVPAAQPMVLRMHYANPGSEPLTATVFLGAEAYEPGTAYTRTATYFAYNGNLAIPPSSTQYTAIETCPTPSGSEFWWLSTHTHHFATLAKVRDQSSALVTSTDWEHPAATVFSAPDFYTFSPDGLTYECTYDNPTLSSVYAGSDEESDENCVGIGYFFPATRPMVCFNSTGPL